MRSLEMNSTSEDRTIQRGNVIYSNILISFFNTLLNLGS